MWWKRRKYVPVHQRRAKAKRLAGELAKEGQILQPVRISGRKVAESFWGQRWCSHFDGMADFANRLPRGRSYVMNDAVTHLEISEGRISALVSGSDMYKVEMTVKPLPPEKWENIKTLCRGRITALVDLLCGRISEDVMSVVSHPQEGLFPLAREITYNCSCPDWASLCKHVAAVFYGVGNRLDSSPELLFLLRGVDPAELLEAGMEHLSQEGASEGSLAGVDLGAMFGVDLENEDSRETAAFPSGGSLSDQPADPETGLPDSSRSPSCSERTDEVSEADITADGKGRTMIKKTGRPAVKPAVKPAGRPAKASVRPASEPAVKTAARPGKPAVRPAGRPAVKTAVKPAGRAAVKPAAKTAGRPAAEKEAKPAGRAAVKPAAKKAGRPAAEPAAKLGRPVGRPAGSSAAKPGRPAGSSAAKLGRPAGKSAPKLDAKVSGRPAVKAASASASKPAAKSPGRPRIEKPAKPLGRPRIE
ncbi:MAG: SWIM zinc finger family protein, partial [Deltaproteobacteria bacterium]|nr:SWIM zinc finger family protein [Deltaproteobacteria bacterium]